MTSYDCYFVFLSIIALTVWPDLILLDYNQVGFNFRIPFEIPEGNQGRESIENMPIIAN